MEIILNLSKKDDLNSSRSTAEEESIDLGIKQEISDDLFCEKESQHSAKHDTCTDVVVIDTREDEESTSKELTLGYQTTTCNSAKCGCRKGICLL
jgi:ERCC4-type nuclease